MPVQPTHVPARHASGLQTDPSPVPPSATHRIDGSTPSQASHVPPVASATVSVLTGLSPLSTVHSSSVPPSVLQLPRLNYTGYCRACLRLGCTEVDCITAWNRLVWQPCPCCHGSGYADIDTGADNACTRCDACTEGLIEHPNQLDDEPVVCAGQPWPGKICAPGWL